MSWFTKIRTDISNIIPAIEHYEQQLDEVQELSVDLKGNVEKHSRDMSGIVEHPLTQITRNRSNT